jgi:hypothetical protein
MAGQGNTNTNSKSLRSFWKSLPRFMRTLTKLITAIGVVLAILVPIWRPWAGDPPSDGEGPEQAIKAVLYQQYRHINQGDYDDAYALFADRSQQSVSLEQYTAFFEARPGYAVDPYKITHVDVQSEDAATVEVVFTADSAVAKPEKFVRDQQIVREDGQWRVVMRDEQIEIFHAAD